MESNKLPDFAARYTAAWCSQNAASVASFFEEKGSLKINEGAPAVGRAAITDAVQGFMTAFPDLVVKMDSVSMADMTYHWTLTGTSTGPGGQLVGYSDVQSNGYIDHFLVSGKHPRCGIDSLLMKRILAEAVSLGVSSLTSHVSRTAQLFFERFGFVVTEQRYPEVRGVVVPNALMCRSNRL